MMWAYHDVKQGKAHAHEGTGALCGFRLRPYHERHSEADAGYEFADHAKCRRCLAKLKARQERARGAA